MVIGFVQGYEELKWGISKLNPLCNGPKGVYPQSDGSLVIVGIDASKGFVDLWVHL